MKNILLFLIILYSFVSCSSDETDENYTKFWVFDTTMSYTSDSNAWTQISTEKKAENDSVVIYVDTREDQVTTEVAVAMASEFQQNISDKVTTNFASPLDVDNNGKIIILVFDIIDDYSVSGQYIAGYFYSADLYSQSSIDQVNPVIKSNQAEIIYIDSNPQDATSSEAYGTIAHEFQHLVNTSKALTSGKNLTDTWLDEGLAEAARHICYGQATDRISYFNQNSPAGHPLFYWDNTNVLNNYSLSYLFLQFIRSQSSLDDSLFSYILNSSFSDYRAVYNAIENDSNLSNATNWGSSNEERFKRLLLRFYAANSGAVNNALYAYDSEITTQPQMSLVTDTDTNLKSGAGVVKAMGSGFAAGVTDYIYLSVKSDASLEDFTGATNHDIFVAVYNSYKTSDHNAVTSPLPQINYDLDFIQQQIIMNKTINSVPEVNKTEKIDFRPNNELFKKVRDRIINE